MVLNQFKTELIHKKKQKIYKKKQKFFQSNKTQEKIVYIDSLCDVLTFF